MKNKIKLIEKTLSNAGAKCEIDIEKGVVLAKGVPGSIDSYGFFVNDDCTSCVIPWKDRASKKSLPKVRDLIVRINETTVAEHFAINPETGQIMSWFYRPHSKGDLKEETVLEILTRSNKLKTGYEEGFRDVMSGKKTPKKAMQDAQKQYLSSLSMSELIDDSDYL
jgi:hypothetical protein